MSYYNQPFDPDHRYQGQVKTELDYANDNFNTLAQAFKNNDPTTGIVNHASLADSVSNYSSVSPLSPLFLPYSQLTISDSQPSSPNIYDTWYNTKDNTLQFYDGSNWQQVDWTKWVQDDIWYKAGRLKIDSGQLKISNNNNDWFQIFPSLGRVVEVVADDTKSDDNSKIAYLAPGQSLLVKSKTFFRAAITYPTYWRGELFYYKSGSYPGGILPSNSSGSDGSVSAINNSTSSSSVSGSNQSSLSYLTIAKSIYSGVFKSFALQLLYYSSSELHYTMTSHGMSVNYGSTSTPTGEITFSKISFPTNGYFIGSFYYNGSTTNIDYALFTRTV
jgi:hypothetical protein